MNTYWTGFIPTGWRGYPPPPYEGRNWTIARRPSLDKKCAHVYEDEDGRRRNSEEIVVIAEKAESAQKCVDLIHAGIVVIDTFDIGEFFGYSTQPSVYTKDQWRQNHADALWCGQHVAKLSNETIPAACILASRASFRTRHVVALHKLRYSYWNATVPPIDLDPYHSPNIARSTDPRHLVAHATAIMLAYSAIEKLELEIRASSENPSQIRGQWNPKVLEDLKTRLHRHGIDPDYPVLWHLRGTPSRIERKRPVVSTGKYPFSRGPVRDRPILLYEAIAYSSFLRSKVSAHVSTPLMKSLSIYDVVNVQSVARDLLLLRFRMDKVFDNYQDSFHRPKHEQTRP